jgi:hypothetical protein
MGLNINEDKTGDELSPESQRIRDVYAHYGLAMYLAQNVERGLSMVLALEGQGPHMTAWDYDARLAENYRSTFGGLVSKFIASPMAASSSLIPRLQRANDQRNDLAHQYFWDRAIQFAASDSQAEMIAELKQMEAEFTSLDDDLGEIVNSLIRDRGQDVDSFHSRVEASLNAFLSGAQTPHNSESVPNPVEVMAAQVWRVNSDEPGNLVLISSEGRHLVPGERGICYGPPSVPPGVTARTLSFDKAFPAQINPRPKTTAPWNYGIPLANGHVLRAETTPDLAPGQFRVWIQRPRRP